MLGRTNKKCPDCNTRLAKSGVRRIYSCAKCGQNFAKRGKRLVYED